MQGSSRGHIPSRGGGGNPGNARRVGTTTFINARIPHGGVRPFHQKSGWLVQLTWKPFVVQIWVRNRQQSVLDCLISGESARKRDMRWQWRWLESICAEFALDFARKRPMLKWPERGTWCTLGHVTIRKMARKWDML